MLWLISPTIQAYFSYQIIISAVETSCLAGALWWSLPGRGTVAAFSVARLKPVWRFSGGMTGISVVVLLLTQTDKIILSKMLSLELFGYYVLAWTVTATLLRIIDPIDSAVYPTLTRLVAQKNEQGLRDLYHKSCQMQIVLLVPAALVLILFGDAALIVWSGDPGIVRNTRTHIEHPCRRDVPKWFHAHSVFGAASVRLDFPGFLSECYLRHHTRSAHGAVHANLPGDRGRVRLGHSKCWLRADCYPDYASKDSDPRKMGVVHLRRRGTHSCSTPNGLGLPSDHAAAAFNPKPNCLHIDCGRIQLFDSSFSRAVPQRKAPGSWLDHVAAFIQQNELNVGKAQSGFSCPVGEDSLTGGERLSLQAKRSNLCL